jgi:KDO2-lipid IV(A) lauroyltransferase
MQPLLKTLTRIPLALLYPVAWFAYVVAFHLLRWRREYTDRDLENAFPELDAARRAALLRRSYRNAADTVVEAFWGFGASADALKARVTIENPEVFDQCAAGGHSIVLLTAHYANWEWLLLATGAYFGLPIDVVYQRQRVSAMETFLHGARSRFGSSLIPREEFIYQLMARAGQPRAYALLADQTPRPEHPKVWTRFLHQDTAFFTGAGKIARFLDAQVVYVAMRRVARGRYTVQLHVLAQPPYADGEDAMIVERYAAALERQIRASPADFLWLIKKWKYPKPPERVAPPAPATAAAAPRATEPAAD